MGVVFGEDDLKGLLATNVHAPHWLRVDGVVANTPELSRAFGCEAPVKRCVVW